eukprot:1921662-Pleurochrysis_carterae.AAC.1
MASSRSSWAASSSGESGVTAAPVSAWLRTQSAAPISKERGRGRRPRTRFRLQRRGSHPRLRRH